LPQFNYTCMFELFHTSAESRDIDTAEKFIGAGAASVGLTGSGIRTVFGTPLLYAISIFALPEVMGLFCLIVAFLILFAR
uniref:Uncharacterized protein n=1 Tax=Cyprinodon variegatus TaxID=28743 RepID=A0A3Q2CJR6_CYPVA